MIIQRIRQSLAWGVRQVLAWLEASPVDPLADQLVARAEQLGVQRGEYKRHWVHARLIKAFPAERKHHLSLAIERAVQRQHDATRAEAR